MKKLIAIVFAAALCVLLAITASAELYNPEYYGILPVKPSDIVMDGKVDAAYGEPIFYFVADRDLTPEEAGNTGSTGNWLYSNKPGDENLFLLKKSDNYVYGYAAWSENALYLCFDTNIEGWNMEGIAADGSDMWKAYCFQLGLFDFNNDSNVDWGVGIDKDGKVLQYNFGQNNGSGTPKMKSGVTDYDAWAVRDGNHIVYEYELMWDNFLSFKPVAGDCIGLDVCLDFCTLNGAGGAQRCITFVNGNYHERNSENARRMFFLNSKEDSVEDLIAAKENAEEMIADEHNIPVYGCNKDAGGMTLDREEMVAGYGALSIDVGKGFAAPLPFDAPVDVSKMDTLEFYMYVSDSALFEKFAGEKMETGFEITSSGKEDADELSWTLKALVENNQGAALKEGWNHVILPLSTGTAAGKIDLTKVNFFRAYLLNETEDTGVTLKLDSIKFTDAQAVKAVKDQEKADKVVDKINAIIEITKDNLKDGQKLVDTARSAFDKLDEAAKKLVPEDILKKLTDAEAVIKGILNPPETAAPETGKETTKTGKTEEKKGCGSVVSGAAVLMLLLAAAPVVTKKH